MGVSGVVRVGVRVDGAVTGGGWRRIVVEGAGMDDIGADLRIGHS